MVAVRGRSTLMCAPNRCVPVERSVRTEMHIINSRQIIPFSPSIYATRHSTQHERTRGAFFFAHASPTLLSCKTARRCAHIKFINELITHVSPAHAAMGPHKARTSRRSVITCTGHLTKLNRLQTALAERRDTTRPKETTGARRQGGYHIFRSPVRNRLLAAGRWSPKKSNYSARSGGERRRRRRRFRVGCGIRISVQ